MTAVFLGAFAFLVMALYDIDRACWKRRLWFTFPLGVLMLIAATLWLLLESGTKDRELWRAAFGGLAAVMAILLMYTQVAVFQPEDGQRSESQELYAYGLYAVCRHPGFWPFLFTYLCLWLYSADRRMMIAGAVFSALNLAYIAVQDLWLFPKYIAGYKDYQKTAPFLIPTIRSIKKAREKI